MIRKTLFVAAAIWAMTLTGCDIYFGPGTGSDCDMWGCAQEDPPPPFPGGPVEPGGFCDSSYDCAPGCYCDANTCVETGFCEASWDCPAGYACDPERATCVPEGIEPPPAQCANDSECPLGSYCDPATATCVPSWGCMTNEECGPGWECNADGTCVPVSCETDGDCFEGCACDSSSGQCTETGFCTRDEDCPAWCDEAGECTPMECDLDRQTCTWPTSEPPPPPPPPTQGSCGGPLTCAVAAPDCPTGETAAILDGCYTGECIPLDQCDVAPLARCERIQNPNQCLNRPDCEPRYTGSDCYCDGTPCVCTDPNTSCECTQWDYTCESI